jgi:hypothetical protein
MEIEVLDYPGLMRVLAWVLNGLDIVAQNAVLSTSNDSVAQNTLWLSTRSGKKLKDASADLLAERVRDFLTYCSPRPGEEAAGELSTGLIKVSNTEHPTYTVITVQERKRTPGFLLEVTSVLTGLNVEVRQGVIQVRNGYPRLLLFFGGIIVASLRCYLHCGVYFLFLVDAVGVVFVDGLWRCAYQQKRVGTPF